MVTQDEEQPASQPANATDESKPRTDEHSPHESTSEKEKAEEKAAPVSNYWKILSFGTRVDHCVLLIALASSAASGTALPLMNIVFGKLASSFNGYFTPSGGVSKSEFKSSINRNALYIVYLFIAKFVLTYIAKVHSPRAVNSSTNWRC
jgi:ATP-binding cassette, subfamily B (MDR/TAP), member 1